MKSTLNFCDCGKNMEPDYRTGNMYIFKCQDPDCGKTKSKHESELHPITKTRFSGVKK